MLLEKKLSPILFYDGNCALCSRFVQFIFRIEKNNLIYFSSLQGEMAQKILPHNLISDLNTVVFFQDNITYIKSQAILNCLIIARPFFLWQLLKLAPFFLSNAFYNFFATHRHSILKNTQCIIPSAEQKNRFLP